MGMTDDKLRQLERDAEKTTPDVGRLALLGHERGLLQDMPEVLAELRRLRNPTVDGLCEWLAPWANQIAARYGRPVYLVGSALQLQDPRDVDVRCIITDKEFEARFGRVEDWVKASWWPSKNDGSLRYAMEIGDLSREASLVLSKNIDFQVQPPAEARRHLGGADRRVDLGPGRRRRLDQVEGLEEVPLI